MDEQSTQLIAPKLTITGILPEAKKAPMISINTGNGLIASFEIYKLVNQNDPVLRTPTKAFDFKNPPIDAIYTGQSLFKTMFANKGLGLSANQVGIPYSIFVCGATEENKQIFFNPKIIEQSPEEVIGVEGCLTYDLLYLNVKRPKWIKVSWQHVSGEVKEGYYDGLTARIIAHEIDHLNGVVFVDKVPKVSLMLAQEKRHKLVKKVQRGQVKRKA